MAEVNFQTHTGNRVEIQLDGRTIGLIQSLRCSENYGLEDASGIGSIEVVEHVPSKAVYSVSISNMALVRAHLRNQLAELNENAEAVMRALVFDIVIFAKAAPGGPNGPGLAAGTRLREIIACSYDSGDIDVTAHRIIMQSAQFKALRVRGQGL